MAWTSMSSVGLALMMTAAIAQDQPPPNVSPAVPDDELAALYTAFCLQSFPDEAGLALLARQKGAVALTPEEVKAILHDDPGHGWQLRTAGGHYQISVEDPPYHTCAIRRMTPSGVSGVKNYIAAVNSYVAAHNGKLVTMAPQKGTLPSGIDVSIFGYGMTQTDGTQTDNFAVILTNYHGRAPAALRDEAANGVGMEVRLVHQFVVKK